ncbi:hypothetical protein C8R46DRAFT_444223 [Mycena filopes]|nr:hypothetical protein C8R46DRAFT_444223 [Mycena filopes]
MPYQLPPPRTTPSFDEKVPISLKRYFADIEDLCRYHLQSPTPAEKISTALRYTPDVDTEDLWKSFLVEGMGWDAFKAGIAHLYPGSDGFLRLFDLESRVKVARESIFLSDSQVGEYHREFSKIAHRLIAAQTISSAEADAYYKKGIHPQSYAEIEAEFERTGRHAEVYPRDEVYEVALRLTHERRPPWLN